MLLRLRTRRWKLWFESSYLIQNSKFQIDKPTDVLYIHDLHVNQLFLYLINVSCVRNIFRRPKIIHLIRLENYPTNTISKHFKLRMFFLWIKLQNDGNHWKRIKGMIKSSLNGILFDLFVCLVRFDNNKRSLCCVFLFVKELIYVNI